MSGPNYVKAAGVQMLAVTRAYNKLVFPSLLKSELLIKYLAGAESLSRPAGWSVPSDTEMEAANIQSGLAQFSHPA